MHHELSLDQEASLVQFLTNFCEEIGIDFSNFNKIKLELSIKVLSSNEIKFTKPELDIEPVKFNH